MPIEVSKIRELLLPGLIEVQYSVDGDVWKCVFSGFDIIEPAAPLIIPKPHIWVPKLTLPEAALVGAAAAIIENPEVTRRFWQGWFK